jgi:hypothetical protein
MVLHFRITRGGLTKIARCAKEIEDSFNLTLDDDAVAFQMMRRTITENGGGCASRGLDARLQV